ISATVSNTGDRDGMEVVQLYLSDPVASVVRPLKRLVGFTKVGLAAGGSTRVAFRLHADRTSLPGPALQRIAAPRESRLRLGARREGTPLEGSFRIEGQVRTIPAGTAVLDTPVSVTPVALQADASVAGAGAGSASGTA